MRWWLLTLPAVLLMCMAVVWGSGKLLDRGDAAAAYDSYWVRRQAHKYRGFQSPAVVVTRQATAPAPVRPRLERMLEGFPQHTLVWQNADGQLGELEISFHQQRLVVRREGKVLIDEQLPRAFHTHALQAAAFRVRGDYLLLFLVKSRATTGRYFVGLYRRSGERLLTASWPVQEIFDCLVTEDELVFLSPRQGLHVALR